MSNKTKLIVAGLVAGFAATASANTKSPVVTLGGSLDTQIGHKTEKAPYKADTNNHKFDSYGIVNDTKVHVRADGQGHGFRYGGLVVLNADTSESKENESSVAHQTMMYVESCLGRLEAGSYTGAYDAMKVNGASLARATGGIDGDWKYWVHTDLDGVANPFTATGYTILPFAPSLPTAFDKSKEANASKVTYYTPTYHGFRAGVSFTPDTDQYGTVTNLKGLTKSYTTFAGNHGGFSNGGNNTNGFTSVFQGGISYKHKFANKVGFKLAALGEIGEAKKYRDTTHNHTIDRHDLRAFEIGAKVTYMGFGIAGSYGDWGKTGLTKTHEDPVTHVLTGVANTKAAHYWTVGVNYVHHCYGMSFGYLNAESGGFGLTNLGAANASYSAAKGKAQVYSFGVDYKIAPGFMPYAEISQFNLKDKSNLLNTGKNSGTVILAGSKLTF